MANPHPNTRGLLRGQSRGRPRGQPNRATSDVKTFLGEVFDDVLTRAEFKTRLVDSIVNLTIDTKLFALLLAYYIGRPPQAFDHTLSGTVTLAQIIAGTVPKDDELDDEAVEH